MPVLTAFRVATTFRDAITGTFNSAAAAAMLAAKLLATPVVLFAVPLVVALTELKAAVRSEPISDATEAASAVGSSISIVTV